MHKDTEDVDARYLMTVYGSIKVGNQNQTPNSYSSGEWPLKGLGHTYEHIYNFASNQARAAGVCCLHFSKGLHSAHWAVPMHANDKHYTARHTCCGSLMCVHSSSFTCSKNLTALHTKSSGASFKVTLSTLLCTRLPAGRQVGKWAVSNVSVPLQDRHYTSLTSLA